MSLGLAIISVWLLCSIWTYIIYARNFWAAFGNTLGWKPRDTAFGIIASFLGPLALIAVTLAVCTDKTFWGLPNLGAPVLSRLPRDPTFIKHYFD